MQLYHNEPGEGGARRFRDVTASAGAALNIPRLARGLAVGDFDGDGDPDLLVSVNNGPALLLENQGPPRGHWLAVRLIGTRSNRDGIGARVRVTAGARTQNGWVRSGGSYGSEDERVARFGLGDAARAERVEVRWPSGSVDRLMGITANQTLIVREGQGSAQ
jgi:enediyne biosynthesis protein E4